MRIKAARVIETGMLNMLATRVVLILFVCIRNCPAAHLVNTDSSKDKLPTQSTQEESFEAAFQGECREDSPCQQLCFDLHDGTFECGCKHGYTLFGDGYTCIENTEYEMLWKMNLSLADPDSPSARDPSFFQYAVDLGDKHIFKERPKFVLTKKESHDPRARTLSQSLASQASKEQLELEEDGDLYRPEIVFPRDEKYLKKIPDRRHHRKTVTLPTWQQIVKADSIDEEFSSTVSIPAASSSGTFETVNTVTMTTVPSARYSRESSVVSCEDLKCHHDAECVLATEKGKYRCRCPIGWSGPGCDKAEDIKFPRFKVYSYLSLNLKIDTSKSLRIEIDFRPELYEGLLFHMGKLQFYCSLFLRNGILELRFSGGSRIGTLRSEQPVTLNSWNKVVMYMDDQSVWLQLNDGLRPEKLTANITLSAITKPDFYLGGYPGSFKVEGTTDPGIQGCIRRLDVNGYLFNFRAEANEDVLEGYDLEECRPDVCNTVSCLNGGQCAAVNEDWGTCLCPLGFAGEQCADAVEILVPSFDGTAHLQFPGLASSSLTFTEILIVFLPRADNGSLLYNGYRINGTGDFLSLILSSGHVVLKFDLGTGPNSIRSSKPVTMNEWHTVLVTRTGRLALLQVDEEPPQSVVSKGGYSQLSLPLNLYLGGIPSPKELASGAEVHNSFVGCVQKLLINGKPVKLVEQALSGVNINNCEHPCSKRPCANGGTCVPNLKAFSCHCTAGYTGPHCRTEIVDMVTKPMFVGTSYLHYVNENMINRLRGQSLLLTLTFRALSPYGLIMWAGSREVDSSSDYLALGLHDGHLRLDYNLGSGSVTLFYNHTRLDDGSWHEIKVVRFKQRGSLTIDDRHTVTAVSPGPLKELNIPNEVFLGGMPNIGSLNAGVYQVGLMGCLSRLTLDTDFSVQFLTMAATGINIQPCV